MACGGGARMNLDFTIIDSLMNEHVESQWDKDAISCVGGQVVLHSSSRKGTPKTSKHPSCAPVFSPAVFNNNTLRCQ